VRYARLPIVREEFGKVLRDRRWTFFCFTSSQSTSALLVRNARTLGTAEKNTNNPCFIHSSHICVFLCASWCFCVYLRVSRCIWVYLCASWRNEALRRLGVKSIHNCRRLGVLIVCFDLSSQLATFSRQHFICSL
jgi:hypothetical protein